MVAMLDLKTKWDSILISRVQQQQQQQQQQKQQTMSKTVEWNALRHDIV